MTVAAEIVDPVMPSLCALIINASANLTARVKPVVMMVVVVVVVAATHLKHV